MSDNQETDGIGAFVLRGIKNPTSKTKKRSKTSWTLLAVGVASTLVVAVIGLAVPGLSGLLAACGFAIVAGVFQVLSVIVASSPPVSDDAVRQQLANGQILLRRIDDMSRYVQAVYETGTAEDRRLALGVISARLIHFQDHAVMSLYGWGSASPDLLDSDGGVEKNA